MVGVRLISKLYTLSIASAPTHSIACAHTHSDSRVKLKRHTVDDLVLNYKLADESVSTNSLAHYQSTQKGSISFW